MIQKGIEDIIAKAQGQEEEIIILYNQLLEQRNVNVADKITREYQQAISQAVDGRLDNDQVRYFLINFGHALYVLGTSLARQGLASDLTNIHLSGVHAVAYLGAVGDGTRKLTREDKQAEATLATAQEELVNVLYTRVTQAVEQRIRSINTIMRTLETIATMNMSEARLGRTQ